MIKPLQNEQPNLLDLAQSCVETAGTVQAFLDKREFPDPASYGQFPKADHSIENARAKLRDDARALYELATGSQELMMETSLLSLQWMGSMRYICHFKIPDAIPEQGEISFDSLAEKCAVDAAQMKQALRFAMTYRLFHEPSVDHVAHTPGSRLLIDGNPMRPFVQWLTEDCAPMITHQVDAMKKWGHGSQEPNQTAVNFAYEQNGPFYEFIPADPVRERRFGATIQQVSAQSASGFKHIQEGFDWKSLGQGTVIDVGGHTGYCAVAIAQAAPELHLIVQDRPEVVAMAQDPATSSVPEALRHRVSFETHDFFAPQKTPADAYFYRKTLLNHTDKYAAKIVAALSPALRSGNRLLIMDFLQGEEPVGTGTTERYYRAVDLQMLLYYNCRYRSLKEWVEVVTAGDARLELEGVTTPVGSSMPIISFICK